MSSQQPDLTPIMPHLNLLSQIEQELNQIMIERALPIRSTLVALLSGHHLVMLGPPGTGKSYLVNEVTKRFSAINFQWLLTKFTMPEEIFGPVSLAALKQDRFERVLTNKLPTADTAFLDEVFKANSAILNSLLTILNERAYDNGPSRIPVPLNTLFAASNEIPQGDDLGALWDRFSIRLMIESVSDSSFGRLLTLAPFQGPQTTLTLAELQALQQVVQQVVIPGSIIDSIIQLRQKLAEKGIHASDRRWRMCLELLQAHALLEQRGIVDDDDLEFLQNALWSIPEQRAEIRRVIAKLVNPFRGQVVELLDQAHGVHDQALKDHSATSDDNDQLLIVTEANTKLKNIAKEMRQVCSSARKAGFNIDKMIAMGKEAVALQQKIALMVLGPSVSDMFGEGGGF